MTASQPSRIPDVMALDRAQKDKEKPFWGKRVEDPVVVEEVSSEEDEDGTESGSGEDEEEVEVVPDEKGIVQLRGKGSGDGSGEAKEMKRAGADLSGVPPELLGEIRKMIQEELGVFKSLVVNEKPKTDARPPKEDVSPLTTTANSSLRRDSGNTVSPLSGSPKQHDIVKFGPSSPTKEPTSPGSPGRQILVRFADKDKTKTIGRTEVSPTSSKSSLQLSSLDEKWGVLFDDRGSATKRLEQVLRGLANYIIDEFMPQKSIVITPEKMASFYSLHKLDSEVYPFKAIFNCRTKGWSAAIEDMYQDLNCDYHLVQKDIKSRPNIPALTPAGFARWMTCTILAYPDAEAKRLNNILSELPINADGPWDGISERLPKQISRHLLPDKPDKKTKRLLDDVMRDFVEEYLPRQSPPAAPLPKIETISEGKRPSTSSTSTSSPRTAKYTPEARTGSSVSSPRGEQPEREITRTQPKAISWNRSSQQDALRKTSPPVRLARANSEGVNVSNGRPYLHANTSIALPPPPLGRPGGGTMRRLSSPAGSSSSPYRRSVGDLASGGVGGGVGSAAGSVSPTDGGEGEWKHYVPGSGSGSRMTGDYTPKSSVSSVETGGGRERATPRRVPAVVQEEREPGPTWDEYLSGRGTGRREGFAAR